MTARCFADTNILVYSVDESAAAKHETARRILDQGRLESRAIISTQVLQEFYTAAIRKLGFAPVRARDLTLLWTGFEVVRIDPEDVLAAIDCSILNRLAFWDGLIITAARKANCQTLWTEDLNHGQIIQGVRVVNPFLPEAGSAPAVVRERRVVYGKRKKANRG